MPQFPKTLLSNAENKKDLQHTDKYVLKVSYFHTSGSAQPRQRRGLLAKPFLLLPLNL